MEAVSGGPRARKHGLRQDRRKRADDGSLEYLEEPLVGDVESEGGGPAPQAVITIRDGGQV